MKKFAMAGRHCQHASRVRSPESEVPSVKCCTYLLPIRRSTFSAKETAELAEYFQTMGDAGRLRGTAAKYFPASVCLFAPLWVLERTLSTYWALYWHAVHGGYPFGDKNLSKRIGRDWISGGRVAAAAAARQPNE